MCLFVVLSRLNGSTDRHEILFWQRLVKKIHKIMIINYNNIHGNEPSTYRLML